MTRTLLPNAMLAASNLRDSNLTTPPARLADLQDSPLAPDVQWWTAPTGGGTAVRFGFENLLADNRMAGLWTVSLLVRRTTALAVPTLDVELWENGSFVATLAVGIAITSTTGQVVQVTFNPALLSNPTGLAAEIRLVGNVATAGSVVMAASTRASVTIAATVQHPTAMYWDTGDLWDDDLPWREP